MKLRAHGIGGNFLQWIENWLSDRKRRVLQWSVQTVLGPLLFVVYINVIDEYIASKILKFADDTKVYHIVNSTKDCEILQTDLHKLVAWSTDWQMLFNTDKCIVMHFGFNIPQTEYDMNGVKLQMVKEVKDLGVIVSADMKWERQCIEVVKKANKMLGLIKRNFQDRSKDTIVPLYKNLVRPHLEYCCQVWYPYLKKTTLS